MKEINLDDKEKTLRKLLEANKSLRDDMKKEVERYGLLEKKYKDLLVKYNILAKENAKHVESLFSMNTGGNIHNYDKFLEKDQAEKIETKASFNPFTSKYN